MTFEYQGDPGFAKNGKDVEFGVQEPEQQRIWVTIRFEALAAFQRIEPLAPDRPEDIMRVFLNYKEPTIRRALQRILDDPKERIQSGSLTLEPHGFTEADRDEN